jgi:ketosteroid isomerase-like protein
MSRENVESFKRIIDASNRRDVEAMLAELDPEFEYHAVLPMLGGEAEYRGHEGMRAFVREVWDALDGTHFDFPDIRDAGDRLVAIGHFRARGRASGVATETPFAYVGEFRDGKAVRVRGYLDAKGALRAAGLEG